MAKRLAAKDREKFDQKLHFPDSKLTRHGMSHIPGCIGVRLNPDKRIRTPGPADYAPNYRRIVLAEPNYSMAKRLESGKRFITPSPNQYTLPGMLGPTLPTAQSAPNYTMRPKALEDTHKTMSPGPAHYSPDNNPTKDRAPNWAFGRKIDKTDQRLGPGPANYLPNLYVKPRPAAYTMGVRHSDYKHDVRDGKPTNCGVLQTY